MSVISTSNTNEIYKYRASIQLATKDNRLIDISLLRINGVVIDYSYDKKNFPLIYVTCSITGEMEDVLIENRDTGTLIFSLKKANVSSDSPDLYENYIEDKFVYFLPKVAPRETRDEDGPVHNPEGLDDINEVYTIGLISLDHINKSKNTLNGVINKGTKTSILYYILKGHKLLIEPPEKNTSFNSIMLPPSSSVAKTIEYLNNINTFYDTPYRFFMDYNLTYLISSSGKSVRIKNSMHNSVIINIRNTYDEANMEGMILNKQLGAYIINVSGTFCSFTSSGLNNKSYNKVFAATSTGENKNKTITDVSTTELTSKVTNIRLPNNNLKLLDNIDYNTKLNDITISISTQKIDASVITIDKQYTINCDTTYGDKYSGQYLLASKKEVYTPEGETLSLNIVMEFKKIPK